MPSETISPEIREDVEVEEEEEDRVTDGSGTESDGETNIRERKTERKGLQRQTSIQRELADAIVRLAPIEELKFLLQCGANVSMGQGCANVYCIPVPIVCSHPTCVNATQQHIV